MAVCHDITIQLDNTGDATITATYAVVISGENGQVIKQLIKE